MTSLAKRPALVTTHPQLQILVEYCLLHGCGGIVRGVEEEFEQGDDREDDVAVRTRATPWNAGKVKKKTKEKSVK